MEAVFKTDRYSREKEDRFLEAYDRVTNTYYRTRDSNLKDQTWSGQIADFMSQKVRPHMKAFLQDRGFFVR